MKKLLVLSLVLLILVPTFICKAYGQQTYGRCYIQIIDKNGNLIPYAHAQIQSPRGQSWYIDRSGADGKLSIWLTSDDFGKPFKIFILDIFNSPLVSDKSEVVCENFDDIKTIKVLNSRTIVVKVYDDYQGKAFNHPPIAAIVNTYSTIYNTISFSGKISALLPHDFKGVLIIGAPLRRSELVGIVEDRDEYEVILKPAVKLITTLVNKNLVIKIQWDSIDPRDMGDKKLIPYSLEVAIVTPDSGVKPLGKYGPIHLRSVSGEETLTVLSSFEEEFLGEEFSGALIARLYMDYEVQTDEYWSELYGFRVALIALKNFTRVFLSSMVARASLNDGVLVCIMLHWFS